MKTLTQVAEATSGQLKQVTRVGTDAVEKAIAEFGLDKDGAQRVHAHGDEFAEVIRTAAIASLKDLSVSDKFKDEEVESSFGYLSGYKPNGNLSIDLIVADFEAQSKKLDGWFNCGTRFNPDWIVCAHKVCPELIEKFFAQFDWRQIASTYSEAVQKVLDTIKQTRNSKLENYREGQIDEKRLRQSARTVKFFDEIANAQGNPDILIVPTQFGIRHRGRSVRRAREVFLTNEFGLGAFTVGIMILTHPERLMNYDDLWIDCGGDEFDIPGSGVRFDHAPFFNFRDGGVWFGTFWFGRVYGHYGSASGLLPQ